MISYKRFTPYLFLVAAVFAVYANIYDNVFLFDDDLLIRLNTLLRSTDTFWQLFTASTTAGAHIAGGFYRPVQNILYFLVFQMTGEQPYGFHLLNIALHAANACLGYRLALRLGFNPNAAMLGILIWALHPLHTEAITYVSGTADPLFVMFSLWGLNILFPTPTLQRVLWTLPVFALALLSKETAVVFPALVCVCWYFKSDRKLQPKAYLFTCPLWLMAIAYLVWRVNSPDFDGPARYAHLYQLPEFSTLRRYAEDPFIRIMTFLATLPAYASLLLWPVGLHMERAFPLYDDPTSWQVLAGIVMLGAALAQIIWNRNPKFAPLSWGLLWFGAAHAPNAGILCPMNSLFLEHWMYLPTLGLFLGIAQTVTSFLLQFKKPALTYVATGLGFVVISLLSARTFDQNKIWRDPIVFYNNIFSHGVTSPRAHNNLAIAYTNIHDLPKAIEEYRRAVKEGDTYAETHFNLALALMSLPDQKAQIPQAIAELERSLQIEPRFYRSYATLAQIYALQGDMEKANAYQHKADEILRR